MNSFKDYLKEACDCWKGHKRVAGTKPCAPGSCVKESLEEGERGLWDNIHAKRKRIKAGSGERMRKPGSKGAPTDAALKASQNEEVDQIDEISQKLAGDYYGAATKKHIAKVGVKPNMYGRIEKDMGKQRKAGVDRAMDRVTGVRKTNEELSADEQFDLIEELVMDLAEEHSIDPEIVWEKLESIDDDALFEAAIDAKGHKSSTGGLTQKGVDAYNRKTGGNLKMAVTTPPSKLKPGSKAANRRKSFCARMSGVDGPMKKPNGEPTRKALALRKWNC